MIPLLTQSRTLYPLFFSLLILFKAQNTGYHQHLQFHACKWQHPSPFNTIGYRKVAHPRLAKKTLSNIPLSLHTFPHDVPWGFLESFWIPVRCFRAHSGHQFQVNKHFIDGTNFNMAWWNLKGESILLSSYKFPIYHKLVIYCIATDQFHNWRYWTNSHESLIKLCHKNPPSLWKN